MQSRTVVSGNQTGPHSRSMLRLYVSDFVTPVTSFSDNCHRGPTRVTPMLEVAREGSFEEGKMMDDTRTDACDGDLESKTIAFSELFAADTIWVRTSRHDYEFSLSDLSSLSGTLTGGFLGDRRAEAVLSGAMSADRTGFDSARLKTGSRAVFFVETQEGVHRVVTSVITDLARSKGISENSPA